MRLLHRVSNFLALVTLATISTTCAGPTSESADGKSSDTAAQPAELKLGAPIKREIQGGDSHAYRLQVSAQSYLRIATDTHHLDAQLILVAPDGQTMTEVGIPAWRWRPEALSAVSTVDATYEIRVQGLGSLGTPGSYQLSLEELRPATASDRVRAAAHAAHARGVTLAELEGDKSAAIEAFEAARGLWVEIGDQAGEARASYWIGAVRTELEDLEQGETELRRALDLQHQLGERGRQADALYRLGIIERLRGHLAGAEQQLQQACELYDQVGEQEPAAWARMNLGLVLKQQSRPREALERYRESLTLFRQLAYRDQEPFLLNNIGTTLHRLGQVAEALEYFQDSLPFAEQSGDRKLQAALLSNIGWGLKAEGKVDAAIDHFQRALRLSESSADGRTRSSYLDNLGRAYLERGEPMQTVRLSTEALELSRELGDLASQATRLNSLGLAYQALEDTVQAAACFSQALEISRRIGSHKEEAVALFGQARLHRSADDLILAVARVEDALAVVEDVRTGVVDPYHKASYLDSWRDFYEFLIRLHVERARRHPEHHQIHLAAALATHERARARSFLESLAEALSDLRSGDDPLLLQEEKGLYERLRDLEQRRLRLAEKGPSEDLERAQRSLREIFVKISDIKQRIRDSNPRYGALTQPSPLSVEQIQRQVLDDNNVLLEYSLGKTGSFLFVLTRDRIEAFDLPPRDQVEDAAQEVYRTIQLNPGWHDTDPNAFRQAAEQLSELVLTPLAGRFTGRRLMVVTDGALQTVPFAALPIPGGGGRLLVMEHEIVNLPSASVLAVQQRQLARRPRAPLTLAVLADPIFGVDDNRMTASIIRAAEGSGLQRLWHSRREALNIAELVPEPQRFLALGFEASLETATDPKMASYRYLHFATHGVLDDRAPELSGLALSTFGHQGAAHDGFLRLHDIYQLELNAELVVLSACRTALGKAIRGEGMIGLTRGFMYAGAERVLASLWQVDDLATAELMQRFYRGLLQHQRSPAAALQAAQIEMLQGDARLVWRHPYYWAAFVLQGN